MLNMSIHHLQFSQLPPQDKSKGGYRIRAIKSNFPILRGMSLYKLILHPKAIREPHWHANADELGYCLKGNVLVSIYATGNVKSTFLISRGEVFFIPSGALHDIENVGEESAELILQFSNEEPEDFGLSAAFGMFSDSVLGNTWHVSAEKFHPIKRSTKDVFIVEQKHSSKIPPESRYPSPYQFNLEGFPPLISNEGGSARTARKDVWPILHRQALYSLILTGTGMREPHWHPETAEMGYVEQGLGRMSILSPSGKVDTYEMREGDMYFIPKAYPHHIENLSTEDLHLLIFFDQSMPADIGFTGSVKSFSPEVLTAVLKSPKELFENLPAYYKDLFIVQKVNPSDL
jgi:oxalate decarboxylase